MSLRDDLYAVSGFVKRREFFWIEVSKPINIALHLTYFINAVKLFISTRCSTENVSDTSADAMVSEADERVATEIELLESMYPEQVSFDQKARDLSYKSTHASMQIRLPDSYLVDSLPDIVSASAGKKDLRQAMKEAIGSLEPGEEVLDSIISSFNDLVEQTALQQLQNHECQPSKIPSSEASPKATVIVYLHHLLNTNKRKMCLAPPDAAISGVTKAGYPGVLIYSGPSQAVHEHVNELKGLNWAAFQIRSEMEGEEWEFKHGKGMIEVEIMGDVVAEVDVKEGRKETYMEAMRMR